MSIQCPVGSTAIYFKNLSGGLRVKIVSPSDLNLAWNERVIQFQDGSQGVASLSELTWVEDDDPEIQIVDARSDIDILKSDNEALRRRVSELESALEATSKIDMSYMEQWQKDKQRVKDLESAVAHLMVKYAWDLSKDHQLSEELKDYVAAHDNRAFLTMFKIRKNIIDILQGERP